MENLSPKRGEREVPTADIDQNAVVDFNAVEGFAVFPDGNFIPSAAGIITGKQRAGDFL